MTYAFLVVCKDISEIIRSERKRLSVCDLVNLPEGSGVDVQSILNIISLGKCSDEDFDTLSAKINEYDVVRKIGNDRVKFQGKVFVRVNTSNTCNSCFIQNHPDRSSKNLCSSFNNLFDGTCNNKQYRKVD